MTRYRMVVVFTLILLVALLAGCSAEALQKSSGNMEKLGKAGLGTAGESVVNEAVELLNGFIEKYEACFQWNSPNYNNDGKADMSIFLTGEVNGEKELEKLSASVVKAILKAAETGASDKAMREALSMKYPETGKAYHPQYYVTYGNFGEVLNGSVIGVTVLAALPMFLSDPLAGQALIAKVQAYDVPIPLAAYDIVPMLGKTMNMALAHMNLITYINNKEQEASPFDVSTLAYIPEGIAANTGDRTYQTVGDKVTMGLLYDIVILFDELITDYENKNTVESTVDYSKLSFEWVLKNCSDQIDRAIADLNTISYINGIHIDAAGLIGTYVSRI